MPPLKLSVSLYVYYIYKYCIFVMCTGRKRCASYRHSVPARAACPKMDQAASITFLVGYRRDSDATLDAAND